MIKLVLWGVRKSTLTHADYYRGNHVVHGDLVREAPPDFQAQILRYTQSYAFDAAYGKVGALWIDSVSELWYESNDSLMANLAHPYYQEVILPDGANFSSLEASIVHVAVEEMVGEPPLRGQGVKVLQSLKAVPGADLARFDEFWSEAHEAAAPELSRLLGFARNRPPEGAPPLAGDPPTGYAAFWLDGRDDIPSFQAYHRAFIRAGETSGLLDTEACFYLLCEERRVLDAITS